MPKDMSEVRTVLESQWAACEENIDDKKEAYEFGWLCAMRFMAGGQQQLFEDLQEELGLVIEDAEVQ